MAQGQAHGLQTQIVLVGPEPRDGVVILLVAHDRLGGDRRHVVGVLDRFQPDHRIVGIGVGVGRAVADGIDIVERGAAIAVDIHPVAARRAGRDQRADRGDDPDPHDHDVAWQCFTAIGHDAGYLAVLALDLLDPGGKLEVDPLGAVFGLVKFGQFCASDARQQAVLHFEQRHFAAQLAQHRGRLQPNIAAADHHRAPRPCVEFRFQRIDIALVAYGVDAGQVRSRAAQPARIAARRPDQLAIANPRLVIQRDLMRHPVDLGDIGAELQLDALVGPEFFGPDHDPLERLVPGQILLGQRRAFVWRIAVA